MALLIDEQFAKDFVTRIGMQRALRIYHAIAMRIERRIKKANSQAYGTPIDIGCVYKTPFEIELFAQLRLGIMLLDTTSCPIAARERNLARVVNRNAMRKLARTAV